MQAMPQIVPAVYWVCKHYCVFNWCATLWGFPQLTDINRTLVCPSDLFISSDAVICHWIPMLLWRATAVAVC